MTSTTRTHKSLKNNRLEKPYLYKYSQAPKEEKVKREHHILVISTSDAARQLIMKGDFTEYLYRRYLTGTSS